MRRLVLVVASIIGLLAIAPSAQAAYQGCYLKKADAPLPKGNLRVVEEGTECKNKEITIFFEETPISDRAKKAAFGRLDPKDLLRKLGELEVGTWSYKDKAGVLHIGPMAQDFHSLFGVGDSDRFLSSVDANGVALAAAKELGRQNAAQDLRMTMILAAFGVLTALSLGFGVWSALKLRRVTQAVRA